MMRIRQRFAAPRLDDVAGAVARGVRALELEGRVAPGARVAVGCSSRGIANYPAIVRATVEALQALGADPFLIPAMGSHGAATAEGQIAVLSRSCRSIPPRVGFPCSWMRTPRKPITWSS
jgi:hypothetical protein